MTLAFVGTPVTHAEFLAEMIRHREMDRIVQSQYWGLDGKGCAVGCAINSLLRLINGNDKHISIYADHSVYAEMTNIPIELIHLEEVLFEGMAPQVAKEWPVAFVSAITQGADLSNVATKFLIRMLREIVLPMDGDSTDIVSRVANGLECNWTNGDTPEEASSAALYKIVHMAYMFMNVPTVVRWAVAGDAAFAAYWAGGLTASTHEKMSHILLDELRAVGAAQNNTTVVNAVLELT